MRSLFLPIALVLLAGAAAGRGRRVRGGAARPPGAEAGAVRAGGGGPGVRAVGRLLRRGARRRAAAQPRVPLRRCCCPTP